MGTEAGNKFVSELGVVKDGVGEWHDWGLAGIVAEVIQHKGCGLLVRIRSTSEQKFEHALAIASRLGRKRLGAETEEKRQVSIEIIPTSGTGRDPISGCARCLNSA
jgi:hypothetical protein